MSPSSAWLLSIGEEPATHRIAGVGKTVLLREFAQIARGHGCWVHEQIEATEDLAFVDGIATLIRKALLRLSVGETCSRSSTTGTRSPVSLQVAYQTRSPISAVM